MSDSDMKLTVLTLQGENVKRVRAIRIVPPRTGLVKIAGRNGQGKSSVLDLIPYGLAGARTRPALPIRRGATGGREAIVLQDQDGREAIRVTLVWTGRGEYLTVEKKAGDVWAPVKSPQDFLNTIVGAGLGFDPMDVMRLRPAALVDRLLSVLALPEDPRTLDASQAREAEARTVANRETRALAARLDAMPDVPAETPDQEVSVAALLSERDEMQAQRDAKRDAERTAREWLDRQGAAERDTHRTRDAVAAAEAALAKAKTAHGVALRTAAGVTEDAERAVAAAQAMQEPDLDDVTARITTADGVNKAVRTKQERERIVAALGAREAEAETISARIEQLAERKRALLLGATFPVAGLGFEIVGGEYTATLNGVPLEQTSDSEKRRVGVGLSMALAPHVRVIIIRDASLLDADTLAEIERMASAGGYQVWVEIVGDAVDGAFIIEDGAVRSEPAEKETQR